MTSLAIPSPGPSAPNRRQDPRFFAALPVTLLSTKPHLELVTWDVSFRGLFLQTPKPEPVRRLLRLSLVSPASSEVILFHGMVVNLGSVGLLEPHPLGMGVELFAVDPHTRAAWWDLVRFVREHLQDLDAPSGVRIGPAPIGLRS